VVDPLDVEKAVGEVGGGPALSVFGWRCHVIFNGRWTSRVPGVG
jgi:hypothetical protein